MNTKPFVRGFGAALVVSVLDLVLYSPVYLWRQSRNLGLILIGALALALATRMLMSDRFRRFRSDVVSRHSGKVVAAGVAVILVGAIALSVRSMCCPTWTAESNSWVEVAQQQEGVPVDGRRTYAEKAPLWLGWYAGWPVVGAALIGAMVVWRDVWNRRARDWVPILAIVLPFLVYLWRPSITPDHLWASRRLIPVLLPALFLLAGAAISEVRRRLGASEPAGILSAPLLLIGALATVPVFGSADWDGVAGVSEELCSSVRDGPVLVVDDDGGLGRQLFLQPLRGLCEVDAAWVHGVDAPAVIRKRPDLVVLTTQRSVVNESGRSYGRIRTDDVFVLEPTVTQIPQQFVPFDVDVFVSRP